MPDRPLLLLHGALGSREQMEPLAAHLRVYGDVLTLDFEGHGTAPMPPHPLRTAAFARQVLAHLDDEGLLDVDVFGYSMGGYVALYLAASAPERIGRIATLGTKVAWTPAFASEQARRLDPERIADRSPGFAKLLAERHGADRWPETVTRVVEMMRALGDEPDLTEGLLAQVRCPVLVVRGLEDEMVTGEESDALAHILEADRVELFRTPHAIEQADVETVAEPLAPWFFGQWDDDGDPEDWDEWDPQDLDDLLGRISGAPERF